jgi:hypothetical protein
MVLHVPWKLQLSKIAVQIKLLSVEAKLTANYAHLA